MNHYLNYLMYSLPIAVFVYLVIVGLFDYNNPQTNVYVRDNSINENRFYYLAGIGGFLVGFGSAFTEFKAQVYIGAGIIVGGLFCLVNSILISDYADESGKLLIYSSVLFCLLMVASKI